MPEHIVSSYDNDLENLRRSIAEMGGVAEKMLAEATEALVRRDTTLAQVPIKQAMLAACDAATVLADHSKFPGSGAGRIALPLALRRLITDAPLEGPIVESLGRRNVEIVTA